MKKFIINILIFFFLATLCSEIYIRLNHLSIDIPRRTIDEYGVQKYLPLQNGYWSNGTHRWQINKEGWAGELPPSFDNLITLIGDSHIENFMNPDSCHLGAILNKSNLKYNCITNCNNWINTGLRLAKISNKIWCPLTFWL